MIITGQGNLPASVPVKCATSGPGLPLGAAPSTSAVTSCALADIFADDLGRLAAADHDRRLQAGLVHDFADGAADDSLDAQFLFFFHRRLDAAPLDEVLRLDDRQHLDQPVGLDRAARREPERNARLRAIVDHDEISAFRLALPHSEQVLR